MSGKMASAPERASSHSSPRTLASSMSRREEALAGRAREHGTVAERPHEPHEPEADVEPGQDVCPRTTQDERLDADLTQAAPSFHGREGAGDEPDQPAPPGRMATAQARPLMGEGA